MQQIITWAQLAEAKHVLFVFDSCFSGTVFKQRSSTTPIKYILDVMAKPVRQFLTAGDADEKVPAKSIFTPLFIRALNGAADVNEDKYVTGNELGLYLRQNLKEYDTQQTPQFGTIRDPDLDEGDIVFRSLGGSPIARLPSEDTSTSSTPPQTRSDSNAILPKPPSSNPPSQPPRNLISKATGVNYTKLSQLLAEKKWKEADKETYQTMLQAADRVSEGWLRIEDIEKFSCEDLGIIDQLWLESSDGKFGFSVQKEIWQKLGSPNFVNVEDWRKFNIEVGWKTEESGINSSEGYVSYNNLSAFNEKVSKRGNLPIFGSGVVTRWEVWGEEDVWWVMRRNVIETLFSNKCL